MAHGHARKSDLRLGAGPPQRERGFNLSIVALRVELDQVRYGLDVVQQVEHFLGFLAVVQGCDDLHGLRDALQIPL